MTAPATPPDWAFEVLACPRCHAALAPDGKVLGCSQCGPVGSFEAGVARFGVDADDAGTSLYQVIEGPRLMERMRVPFTTSSLDAPVYEAYMQALRPADPAAVIVDAGAGDGRNTEAWLSWGYERVVATDAIPGALLRLRAHLEETRPEALERLLLVESDIRKLPIATRRCDVVLALEVLCLLNREYEAGLAECARLVRPGGRLLVSDYAAEGALFSQLLYGGVDGLLEVASNGTLPHVQGDVTAHARLLEESELAAIVEAEGLVVEERKGISLLSPLLGFMRGIERLGDGAEARFGEIVELMKRLGAGGAARRTHVVVAARADGSDSTDSGGGSD